MYRAILLFPLVFALLAAAASAQTGPAVETGHASTRLVMKDEAAAPGETALIALYQALEDHWHVYWRNPGDSGLPLEIDWDLPAGFEAGEIAYPLPHRLPLGPLVNFGHEGTPVFLIPVEVPEDAVPGTTARIEAEASWLICKDICVPERARLSLDMPIAETAGGLSREFGPAVQAALDAQPVPAPFDAYYYLSDDGPGLVLGAALQEPVFFPHAPNLIEPSGAQTVRAAGDETQLRLVAGFALAEAEEPPATLGGVVVAGPEDARRGYVIGAAQGPVPARPSPSPSSSAGGAVAPASLAAILLFAFLGGLVLNVMPCVFPVVFMKAAGLAQNAGAARGEARRHGLLYLLGVVLTFLALAGLLLLLRAGGEELGWGFQLQNPVFVGFFAVVIFLVGLNLAGLFELGTSVQGAGQGLAGKGGDAGAFFTGMLAVAVAAPCIGPFLGVPVGYALSQPAVVGLSVFAVIGLGLAAPFVLLSFSPALGRLLPRPGPWMATAKQLLSFGMFAALVWLAWVLSLQAGPPGVLALGLALLLAGFAAWAFGLAQKSAGRGAVPRIAALAALALAVLPLIGVEPRALAVTEETQDRESLPTVAFSPERLAALRSEGRPVFVDFTAAWCVTCQVNKQTVLNRRAVIDAFHAHDALYMVADWTGQDPAITAALEEQGRSGVPLYLYYAEDAAAPQVLPQILSVDGVIDTLRGESVRDRGTPREKTS